MDAVFPTINYLYSFLPLFVFYLVHLRAQQPTAPRGCRRLGLPADRSNLQDEYDPKYSQGVPETQTDAKGCPSWRIKALFTYPIKSCTGVELDVADVVPTGLQYDRQFCFAEYMIPQGSASKPHWTARTMREGPFCRLALIRPEIWIPDPAAPDYHPELEEVKSQGVLLIKYPRPAGTGFLSSLKKLAIRLGLISRDLSFRVPLYPPSSHLSIYPSAPVKVWKDAPFAFDYAQHVPTSLRDFLCPSDSSPRGPLTLFRVDPSHHREIFRCAPRKEDLGFQTVTGFADAYPLHLLNVASVQDVAERCSQWIPRLSIRRFRANIIVQGPSAFAEDAWKRIRIAPSPGSISSLQGVEIYTVCRTMRCKLPNVDPDTGIRHRNEPDRTLKSYRCIDPGDYTNAALGMQLVPAVEEFTLSVGDAVSVVETGEHFYIKMLAPGEKVEGV
ncbi:MOSC-domain-containing protein [Aspergillus steynii IBT 23096]|uniref:MOSC-domain-containing protein n=1 Tax=Aspergillus steynii IBT 23096 TaxID=1392250 RepID=A0A2I2FZS3_9EURO|nr:MOSC-domain-containing protein [Aspergillus steynii IBT 23096]PLB46114.1 MOSC-domain-containing protein [Aspergillus steynii IBT 23096]